jgi:hypothetical protein
LKPASAADLPLSIGNTDGESWDLDAHIGLVVFNVTSDQCASEPIPVGSFVWSGAEWQYLGQEGSETLASGVSKHPAKPGVYEEFYYADFGTAGIWMTTNLTAYKYDGNRHSTDLSGTATSGSGDPRTLTGPNANPLVGGVYPYNTAYWSYPKPDGAVTPGESAPLTWDSRQGLLYTWDAATAGKGGSNGQGNIDGPLQESGYRPEGSNGGTNEEKGRQGICPDGWHLPSDWEWTELEQAIIRNKAKYSSAATSATGTDLDNELAGVSQPPSAGTAGVRDWRGLTTTNGHGNAMKSPCPVPLASQNPSGLSKTMEQNGFAALLAGIANGGSANNYGDLGFWWSASSGSSTNAWARYVDGDYSQVTRHDFYRNPLLSVRCKKD